jgi:GNAT superfamily N-acetyltransferase
MDAVWRLRLSHRISRDAIVIALADRDGDRCWYCGCRFDDREGGSRSLTIDHVQAVAGGGGSSLDNLRLCCRTCNQRKGQLGADAYEVSDLLARRRQQMYREELRELTVVRDVLRGSTAQPSDHPGGGFSSAGGGSPTLIRRGFMKLDWIREQPANWDDDKARIVGGAPAGVFDFGDMEPGAPLAGEWWRVDEDGATAAYAWIDTVWGDAEMLLAVDPARQGRGVGTFVLECLEMEAARRGLNYLYNVVRPSHPDKEGIAAWLEARSFEPGPDGLLRRKVPTVPLPPD